MDTFYAAPVNGGTTPSYQWYHNGVRVGNNSSQLWNTLLADNDSIWVVMRSNASCASPDSAVSNKIHVTISPATPPSVHNVISCSGLYDTLIAIPQVPGGTFSWSPGGFTTQSIIVHPTITTYYTVRYSLNGCVGTAIDTVTVISCAQDTVWPGDADANRMVSNNDLLTIGQGSGSTGPVRTVQGIVWQGDEATNWTNNFTIYTPLVNYNHADCNGDGVINADDTLAIVTNFGDVHSKSTNLPGVWRSGMPTLKLQLSKDTVTNGDTLITSISLGSATMPANNVYGLAFTFNYDTRVDTLGSFSFVSSWLGTPANSININRNFRSTGEVKAAITGINHTTRSGNGVIATFRSIITTDNINGKDLSYYANSFYISDITAIDQNGDTIPLNADIDTGYVAFTPNGIHDITQPVNLKIYPNPAKDQLMVTAGVGINEVSVSDILGQNVMVQKIYNKQSEIIDVSALEVGVYIVHVSTISGEGTARLIISR